MTTPSPNAARALHEAGQSLWLDNITRSLVTSGALAGYIAGDAVTGLTSNPTIFDKAITGSADYDPQIRELLARGQDAESAFFSLALADLTQAAAQFRPIWDATGGRDGWVSLEVSPRLARDAASTVAEARALHAQAAVPNLFIKVPGTPEGLPAIEELIFEGISVNVTLLFSAAHWRAAADAYRRGLERRRAAGRDLGAVGSVASVFISRWDHATMDRVPEGLRDRLGVAVAKQTYREYCAFLASEEWRTLAAAGAAPQRLLWASTGTKDPALPDTFYVTALAAPETINTMPEATLRAFADHGSVGALLPADGGDAEETLAGYRTAGVDVDALGEHLQVEGAQSFVDSWDDLLACVAAKARALGKDG